MFGQMNVIRILDLRRLAPEDGSSVDSAVARLLEATDHPKIEKWIQLPQAVFVFLVVAGDPESGAFYVYDRRTRVWFWVDFEDDKFGGYTVEDFERLVRECRFLDLVEKPLRLTGPSRWLIRSGTCPELAETAAPE